MVLQNGLLCSIMQESIPHGMHARVKRPWPLQNRETGTVRPFLSFIVSSELICMLSVRTGMSNGLSDLWK